MKAIVDRFKEFARELRNVNPEIYGVLTDEFIDSNFTRYIMNSETLNDTQPGISGLLWVTALYIRECIPGIDEKYDYREHHLYKANKKYLQIIVLSKYAADKLGLNKDEVSKKLINKDLDTKRYLWENGDGTDEYYKLINDIYE